MRQCTEDSFLPFVYPKGFSKSHPSCKEFILITCFSIMYTNTHAQSISRVHTHTRTHTRAHTHGTHTSTRAITQAHNHFTHDTPTHAQACNHPQTQSHTNTPTQSPTSTHTTHTHMTHITPGKMDISLETLHASLRTCKALPPSGSFPTCQGSTSLLLILLNNICSAW